MKIGKKIFTKRSVLISAVCAALFVLLCVRHYQMNVTDMRIYSAFTGTIIEASVEDATIEQTLVIPHSADTLSLFFATGQREMKGQTNIRLVHYPEGTLIQEWDIANETIEDRQYHTLTLKEDFFRGDTDEHFALIIESGSSCVPGGSPSVCYWESDPYFSGALYINGNLADGDLCFEICSDKTSEVLKIFIFVAGILLLLLLASVFLLDVLDKRIEIVFVICVLLLGIAYLIVLPAESAPDEDRHILTAYNLSNTILGGPEPEEALVYFREQDLKGLYGEHPNGHTYTALYRNFFEEGQGEDYVLVEKDFIIQTPFWTYLPPALGISLGRVLNCNGTITIMLGRLFSLLFYIGATCFSIKIIPFGKKILLAISLLPMTMELAASYSYDSMIIALSFLYIALMCRLIFEKEALTIRDIVVPTVVMALLAPHKYVYLPLVLLALFLPGEKYKAKREKWISIGIMLGGTGLVLLSVMGGERVYIPGFDTTEYRTIEYCLRNPREVITVYVNTLLKCVPFYGGTMLGAALGWLELYMPRVAVALSGINLLMATVKTDPEDRIIIKNRHHLGFLMCALSVSFMVLTAMLLVWTPVTSMEIKGVQGRYFLPVLPLFLFCAQKINMRSAKNMVKPIVYVGFLANVMCLLRCFTIITGR